MINHARTVLLNTRPQKTQRQDAGYEYMPETFRPLALPPALATIHKVLFGTKPDMYFLNLRARELLSYIHQTELAEYAYKLDPRVTYATPTDAPFFENAKPTITIVQTAGLPLPLSWGGTFSASDATGITTKQFEIVAQEINSAYSVSLRAVNSVSPPEIIALPDPTQPPTIKLPDTNLQFKLNLQATTVVYALMTELADIIVAEQYAPVTGLGLDPVVVTGSGLQAGGFARWNVTARANPKPAITTLLPILEILGEPLFLELFGVASVEPYVTFKNLWSDHPLAAYRLAGLVLAFIYRAEELRKVNDG